MDRRTLALGVVAAIAVATAIAVAVVNERHSTKRSAVASYIDSVDRVQQQMRLPLTRVLQAYHDFTRPGSTRHDSAKELANATRTLATVRRRIAAVTAPPQAARLHRLMLELVDQETNVTMEVQQLAAFVPRYRSALAAYQRAGAALSRSLAAVQIPKPHRLRGTRAQIGKAQRAYAAASVAAATDQADVVDAYDGRLLRVLAAFQSLRPPNVLAPAYRAQILALVASRAAGARLAAGLRSPDRSRVPVLGRAFTEASRVSQSVAAQEAEIAAIRAYNRRARAITTAASRVQAEVGRLQQALT